MNREINIDKDTAALEAYALKHYEDGGHWVYETYDRKNYVEVLEMGNINWDLAKAKDYIKRDWELAEMQCRECSSGEDWSGF